MVNALLHELPTLNPESRSGQRIKTAAYHWTSKAIS